MIKYSLSIILLFISHLAISQYQIGLVPRVSPDKAVFQKIGYTEVNVKYGSPATKDREIWGMLVPYNNVWRAGANNATTVEFNSKVTINKMSLDSGKYSLFMIPRENDRWTIIFNKTHKQWGAFKYDENEDALRVDILPKKTANKTENLNYSISQVGYKFGSIILNWDFLEIEIPFETNYLQQFQEEVESRANKQAEYIKWVVFVQGAEHLVEIKSNESLAERWINEAENIMSKTTEWNDQFYPREYIEGHLYWIKASLLARSNKFKEAIEYSDKLMSLKNTMYYDRKNEVKSIDASIEKWKKEIE